MLHYFYGPDTYGAREALGALAEKEQARIQWVEGADLSALALAERLAQGGGLFGKSLVVARDPASWGEEQLQSLIDVARSEGLRTWVVWDRGEPDKRKAYFKALQPRAQAFPAWDEGRLVQWLTREAKQCGGSIAPAAARVLVLRLGVDRWRLGSELERLVLLDGNVSEELVRREVAAPLLGQIFALLDAVTRGNGSAVIKETEALLSQGETEFMILGMLAYQFRSLLQVQAGLKRRWTEEAIARAAKLHPYAVRKSLPAAQWLPEVWVEEALTRVAATDYAIKRGKVEARTGLLMLLLGLTVARSSRA